MLTSTLRSLLAGAALAAAAVAQLPMTFGNLVVVRVGDGTASLSSDIAPVFLDEYTPLGALVQTIALPTAASGANRAFGVRGSATSEAFLNVGLDGLHLTLGGYDAIPGTTNPTSTLATAVPRVVASIDVLGNVDTSTALQDAYSGGNIRAAIGDGVGIWTSGTSTTEGGIRYVANVGATTSLGLNAGAPSNTRTVNIFDGQLYTSSASTIFLGVCKVGIDLPTTPSQVVELLPGFPTTGGTDAESAYDYFFADPDTLYVADDNTTAVGSDGGIQKWTQAGGVWTKQYTLTLAPGNGCRGLTGFVQGGVTTLWGTFNTNATGGNQTVLGSVVDTGLGAVVTPLATSAPSTAFRGLRFLGLPSSLQHLSVGCGSATIAVHGNGQIGTDVRTTVRNAIGLPLIGYGTQPLNLPFCNCTLAHEFTLLFGPTATHTLALPNSQSVIGALILVQGVDFLAPNGCPDPMLTLTDAFSFTVQ